MAAPVPANTPPVPPVDPNLANPQELPPEHQEGHKKVSFWQEPWVQTVIPFATSLIIHIGIVLIAYTGFITVKKAIEVIREQPIIPDASFAENGQAGGIENPGLGGDPTKPPAQDQYPDANQQSEGWANKPSETLSQSLMGGGAGDSDASSMIALGAGAGMGKGGGVGTGAGSGVGGGTGDGGGELARYGIPGGGGGIGPKASFAGVGGNAKRIVFVCDASGTMMNVFSQLKVEVQKAVSGLVPIQSFNIIFFSDDQVEVYNKGALVMANPANKRKAAEFVGDLSARGGTNPLPAIKAAFDLKPELIYVLTDGFDNVSNFDEVINTFKSLNPDKKIKVNCIYLQSKGANQDSANTLKKVLTQITDYCGGVLKVIDKSEF